MLPVVEIQLALDSEYAAEKVQEDRERWCTCSEQMVHDGRRAVHNRHAVSLLAETSTFPHGIALDFNRVGVIYNAIADSISNRRLTNF